MARKTASRLQKRREVEAAETKPAKKKEAAKGARKRTTRRKVKAPDRKRLLWGVYSGTMKEEGRYAYDQRAQAEEKLEQLRAKSKKLYFIQPIKEVISDGGAAVVVDAGKKSDADAAPRPRRRKAAADDEE